MASQSSDIDNKVYRITEAKHQDGRYGPCECCGKEPRIMYKQQWR